MDVNELRENVLSVLQAELSEKDFSIFVLKTIAGMSNCAIGRSLKITESAIRKRMKQSIEPTLSTKTAYIYENDEFIDMTETGEIRRTTAKFRNMNRYLKKSGLINE